MTEPPFLVFHSAFEYMDMVGLRMNRHTPGPSSIELETLCSDSNVSANVHLDASGARQLATALTDHADQLEKEGSDG